MENIVKVGMADMNTVSCSGILVTLGLGSCVGVALYDKYSRIAGLAHIMLPNSKLVKNNDNPAKFADTAIEKLLEEMNRLGAKRDTIVAKIAGGAQMFSFKHKSNDLLKIGERNIVSAKQTLIGLGIPVVAEDTGGNFGRTVELYAETGAFLIKTIGYGIKEI
jgi:chemotaxis protein CheD